MKYAFFVLILAASLQGSSIAAQPAAKITDTELQVILDGMWSQANAEFKARVPQDETQRICTQTRNQPDGPNFEKIVARETATVIFPSDGKVMGDWKKGGKIAQSGAGGQFSDNATVPHGGNCYACHQIDKAELSYGNLGPVLTGYGKDRKYSPEEAKAAYMKIYNAQSVQACSNMPRFGTNKFLTIEQIKDVTAYLMDPASPVNQ